MTPETDIHAALMARVETLEIDYTISYPKRDFSPLAGLYLRVTHLRNEPVRRTLDGSRRFMRMGILQIDVFSAQGDTSYQITSDAVAEDVASNFAPDLVLGTGSEAIRVSKTWIGQGRKDEPTGRWMTPVFVDYRPNHKA